VAALRPVLPPLRQLGRRGLRRAVRHALRSHLEQGGGDSRAWAWAALSDLVLTAGKGFNAPDGYRFGFALKYVYRLRFDDRLVGTTDPTFYKVKQAWEKPDNGWSDKLAKIKVAGDIAETTQGVGLNLGAEKDIDEKLDRGPLPAGLPHRDGPDLPPGRKSTSAFPTTATWTGFRISTTRCWSTSTGSAS